MPSGACWPCRDRKVKCDANETGLPCARCQATDRVDECHVPPRQKRKIVNVAGRRAKHPRLCDQSVVQTDLQPESWPSNDGQTPLSDAMEDSQTCVEQFRPLANDSGMRPSIPQSQPRPTGVDTSLLLDSIISSPEIPPGVPVAGSREGNEDDVLAQICQKIAAERSGDTRTTTAHVWAEGIEYQNSLNATGILGEVLARRESTRLIRINHSLRFRAPEGSEPRSRRDMELFGLDEHDISHLSSRGVFILPPGPVCEGFFEVYFRYVYPYAPVVDRAELLAQYDKREASSFLLQALLANVVPYASKDLIDRAGFKDHASAQKAFYRRATLLYDFNCEKSQLTLLQGSLLLGTQWVSYFGDKDYQFWMCNAIRLSTRMGINRRHIEQELDPKSYRLLKRIWWTIYKIRDVLTTISGLDNGRPARPKHDTLALDDIDWLEEDSECPYRLRHLLLPVQSYHKQFFIQLSQLALLGHVANRTVLDRSPIEIDSQLVFKLLESLFEWRSCLPRQLRIESVRSWKDEGIWVLVLMVWYYRLECMVLRTLRKAENTVDLGGTVGDIGKRLHASIFELDALVRRAVVHQIGKLLPMSFSTAVATLVSLCVEMLLGNPPPHEKLMCEEAVRTSMAFLTDSQEAWPCLRWMLRMFEWAFKHAGLQTSLVLPATDFTAREPDHFVPCADTLGPESVFFSGDPTNINMDFAFLSAGATPDWQSFFEV